MNARSYLAVCAIFKDEANYLAEWLQFYRSLGVEHFLLYDNQSSDRPDRVIAETLPGDMVTLNRIEGATAQARAYGHCIRTHGRNFRWIGFFDLDEFCFPIECDDLRQLLQDFEEFPALGVNWAEFGSSRHTMRPDGPVTRAYTRRGRLDFTLRSAIMLRRPGLDPRRLGNFYPQAAHIKSIVDPSAVEATCSAHHFRYKSGALAVSESFQPIASAWSDPPSIARVRVNHYWTKSQAEFAAKLERPRADSGTCYDADWAAAKFRCLNDVEDLTIQPLLDRMDAAREQRR